MDEKKATDTPVVQTESTPSIATTTSPEASPVSPENPTVLKQPVVESKKGSSCWKIGCISCGVLTILLVVCGGVGLLSLGAILRNSTTGNDFDKSKFTTYDPNSAASKNTLQEKIDSSSVQSQNGNFTVTVTEKELIDSLANSGDAVSKDALKGIYVSMQPNLLTLKVDLKSLLEAVSQDQRGGLDPKSFEGIYITAEISVSSDQKSFTVNKASTGNSILDSFLGDSFANGLEEGLNQALKDGSTNGSYEIQKIVIRDKAIDLTFLDKSTQNNSDY